MTLLLLCVRLLLALVFLVAGLAKLADLAGSQQALRDFGVPARLANPFGVLLPLAELAIALVLLLPVSAWWGALGALALLLLFVVGIGSNLAHGRQPDCHCFGQLHSAPAGWPTFVRNLVLAALAAVVVVFGWSSSQLSVVDWLAPLSVSQRIEVLVGLLVLVLLLAGGWLLVQVLSQQGRLLLRIEALEAELAASGMAPQSVANGQAAVPVVGLPVGNLAPGFALPTLADEPITLAALRGLGKPVLLLFSDPGCGPCTALLPEVGRWQREQASRMVVALVSRGTVEANRPKVTEYGLTHVLLQHDREVAQAYQAAGTPSAVLIRRDGTIGSPLAQGADAIRALVDKTLSPAGLGTLPMAAANGNGHGAAPRRPAGPKVGEPAPDFSLPDLSGQTVSLSDFRGDTTLLLFWRPSCGFCQRMLTDLQAWEANPPKDAPGLLVVSTDSVESNQAMGLRSPVLLDQEGMSIGRLFGATGTPMAVLVDAQGNIASELAAGAPAVLALAGQDARARA
ncbi:MAG: redoxin domain-containing protein [Chloroflexi bacterium]|nr:MAG: redoxin domain-containing protein [Chloroflexota bacterium]